MAGCNSCKHLDPDAKIPGKTSGYLYKCEFKGAVNAATDSCAYYEEDFSKTTADRNELYRNSKEYNNDATIHGCNSCAFLEPKEKSKDKYGNVGFHCSKKDIYVNAAKDNCELWENAHRSSMEENDIYRASAESSGSGDNSVTKYLILLIIVFVGFLILKLIVG